jgi:uncharacterized protein YyaL (SSP411 family)
VSGAHENRLRDSLSPYLLQHAKNPVDWHPWGEEALEKARKEDKPIFLSIGYAACHWCHVMEHESFENVGIASYMNQHFVNIKVDREERPDIDEIYMNATLALSGSGGWPMSVFLTPDRKPFYAGTYFPPESRYGRPGFPQLLAHINEAWKTSREECTRQADRLVQAIQRMGTIGSSPGLLTDDLTAEAAHFLVANFDDREGGFGDAPKFPNPAGILVLLREHRRTGDAEALRAALFTLRKMAEGGIYDQLGGGFSRYSVDDRWLVPHFEKMLYDNAQLARAYLAASKVDEDPLWARIVRETLDYVLREMQSPEGGFYSTQDADSEGEEGKFFVWSQAEVQALLGSDAADFARVYDVTAHGNFEGHNILHPVVPLDAATLERMKPLRKKLWEVREKRVKPGLDDKVLADWNGYMIQALAEAGPALDEPRYTEAARRAARFWASMVMPDLSLDRVWRRGKKHTAGLQIDYASLALGLTALYQATFEVEWLELARKLAGKMVELFWDEADDGFFATEAGSGELIARTKSPHDGATPSGNSVAAHALLALHRLTGDPDLRVRAEKTMRLFRDTMEKAPPAVLNMIGALQEYNEGPPEIALVGKKDDPELTAMLAVIRERFLPGLALAWRDPATAAPPSIKLLEGKDAKDGKATAHVCRDFACERPVTTARELAARLDAPPGSRA